MVVESRRTDPRNGEVLYQLVNVIRVEPAADLFQVPSDYTVVERARPSFRPPPRQNEIPSPLTSSGRLIGQGCVTLLTYS